MGLLSKASEITTVNKLAFPNFIISHKIKTFAVFQLNNNYYSIVNSIGFDGTSLLSSLSTKDFWDGICPDNNKIYNLQSDNKSLNPMLQFFSFELIEQIKYVSLYKSDDKIFMLCNKDFDQSIISELNNIDYVSDYINLDELNKQISKDSKLIKSEIIFSEAINNFISLKGKDIENKENAKSILLQELQNRFKCYLAPYSTKVLSDNTVKSLFNVDNSILDEHLICHLVYNLRSVIGKSAEMLSFNMEGIADSIAEIKSYLQVE